MDLKREWKIKKKKKKGGINSDALALELAHRSALACGTNRCISANQKAKSGGFPDGSG